MAFAVLTLKDEIVLKVCTSLIKANHDEQIANLSGIDLNEGQGWGGLVRQIDSALGKLKQLRERVSDVKNHTCEWQSNDDDTHSRCVICGRDGNA